MRRGLSSASLVVHKTLAIHSLSVSAPGNERGCAGWGHD